MVNRTRPSRCPCITIAGPWALLYPLVVLSLFPGGFARLDGVVIGLILAALALIKVTYFVAFFPAIAAALWLRGARFELVLGAWNGGWPPRPS